MTVTTTETAPLPTTRDQRRAYLDATARPQWGGIWPAAYIDESPFGGTSFGFRGFRLPPGKYVALESDDDVYGDFTLWVGPAEMMFSSPRHPTMRARGAQFLWCLLGVPTLFLLTMAVFMGRYMRATLGVVLLRAVVRFTWLISPATMDLGYAEWAAANAPSAARLDELEAA